MLKSGGAANSWLRGRGFGWGLITLAFLGDDFNVGEPAGKSSAPVIGLRVSCSAFSEGAGW